MYESSFVDDETEEERKMDLDRYSSSELEEYVEAQIKKEMSEAGLDQDSPKTRKLRPRPPPVSPADSAEGRTLLPRGGNGG